MRVRAVITCALAAIVLAVPPALAASTEDSRPAPVAKQASIAEGVATAIAAEIVKSGIKAAVAQWAPDLTKYVDPTGHGLEQIQAQLAEIDRKLNELIDRQQALEEHLNCVTQRVAVARTLSDARSWFATLRGAARIAEPAEREAAFARLYANYEAMVSDQDHLHHALIGPDGLIVACARHIEKGLEPYLSAALAADVEDFYSIYRTAASELLIVRVNMIALHAGQFAPTEARDAASQLEGWWREEAKLIKPAFPSTMSYDVKSRWLWRLDTVPWWNTTAMTELERGGWRVTGRSTTPTCSGIEAFVKQSRLTGRDALSYLEREQIIRVPSGATILCYDDHDRIHDFDLANYHYRYAGDYISHEPSVAARPNDGLVSISRFSYLNG